MRVVFAGVVAAVCAVTLSAQIKRTVLQQVDTSIPGREVVTARADFPAGGSTGLHTHPGDEISFVAEGAVEIVMEGSSKVYRKGEAFNVIGGKPHDAKAVEGPATVIANYVIEKGKPATTPVK
ncbi:MAG TPA: cupin domain-containing protein [Vicinamibacterales bacterium]|nr:cupin domain-containing protein [Vicinamibacterales bacterium]